MDGLLTSGLPAQIEELKRDSGRIGRLGATGPRAFLRVIGSIFAMSVKGT
jgi:hypothetical protein